MRPGIFVNWQFQQIFVRIFVQIDEKIFPKKHLTNHPVCAIIIMSRGEAPKTSGSKSPLSAKVGNGEEPKVAR